MNVKLPLDGLTLDAATLASSPLLPYLAMVVTVLEGRVMDREQLSALLRQRMRQRSIGRWAHREYVLHQLNQHPP